ncbi:UNVERIFIED_CONTAM: hypothetical protein FKN15_063057 [Acipenser sinensis]
MLLNLGLRVQILEAGMLKVTQMMRRTSRMLCHYPDKKRELGTKCTKLILL